jgi:hypothetical protein
MLNPGAVSGERYRVVRELAGGGMKLVYLVEDAHLNRKAALAEMIDSFTRRSCSVRRPRCLHCISKH